MADVAISDLNNIGDLQTGQPDIQPNDLFLAQQASTGNAVNVTGEQLTKFINRAVVDVTATFIPATTTGSSEYDAQTGELTLNIPKGDGIASITKTGTSGATDTYTITLDTGATYTFQVTNGSNISTIAKTSSRTYNGRVIDTYTVTLTDGSTTTFEVTNGKDGEGQVNKIMGLDPTGINGNFTTNQMMQNILPLIMPVGYLYISPTAASPASIYGAYGITWTWTQVKGRFLVATGKADEEDPDCPEYSLGAHGTYKATVDFSNGAAKIGFGNGPYNYTGIDYAGSDFTDISHVGQMAGNWGTAIPTDLLTNGVGMAALTGTQDIELTPLYYGVTVWRRTE